jgi:two-component system CheB/CheR fusion protein
VFLDRDLVIRSFTPAVASLFNILPGDRGRPLTDLSSRLALPNFIEDIRAVLDSGKAIETEARHQDIGTHFVVRLAPYRGSDRRAEGVVVTFVDVTRLAQAQAHQQTLIAELNHRVKNMLMVAISIAQQTHKASANPQAFIEAFIGRLQAMARSYELLSRENWTESSLVELVRTELSPFGLERLAVDGPDVSLTPKLALSLGMVLHELSTNAAKYGALSAPSGKVAIQWSKFAGKTGDCLNFQWREIDGPAAPTASKRGFGLRLIEKETSANLGGRAEIEFKRDGLVARLVFPLNEG